MNNPLECVIRLQPFGPTLKNKFSICIFQLSPLFTTTLNAQFKLLLKLIYINSLALCVFKGQNEHLAKWGKVSVHFVTSQRAEWVLNTQFMKSGASTQDEQWAVIIWGELTDQRFSIPASSCTHLGPFCVEFVSAWVHSWLPATVQKQACEANGGPLK